jgi:hypothetical protein
MMYKEKIKYLEANFNYLVVILVIKATSELWCCGFYPIKI